MKVITLCNKKGGVGKTTLAVNLAALFSRNNNVLLVDADEQATAMKFREKRSEVEGVSQFSAVQILTKTIHQDIRTMTADVVIIDVGAGDSKVFRSALMCSQLVIVPFKATVFDIESTQEALEIIDEIRTAQKFALYGLFNMLKTGTRIMNMIDDLKLSLSEDYNMKFFDTIINSRVSYAYAAGQGLAVDELAGKDRDQKAVEEICEVFQSIQGLLS